MEAMETSSAHDGHSLAGIFVTCEKFDAQGVTEAAFAFFVVAVVVKVHEKNHLSFHNVRYTENKRSGIA